jgi:hypothetical protein
MQTLGLSGETKRSDGWLKSIFWPTVENAWDVDYLGRQGFWICLWIAIFQLVVSVLSGNPIVIAIGVAESLAFLIGGMGVRQSNWPAAALVFSLFLFNQLYAFAMGQFPGALSIIGTGLLLSNLRAAFLASEWRPAAEDEDKPTRFNDSLRDKLVDQLPARVWPALQIPFFGLASILLLLTLVGLGLVLMQRLGIPANTSVAPH